MYIVAFTNSYMYMYLLTGIYIQVQEHVHSPAQQQHYAQIIIC